MTRPSCAGCTHWQPTLRSDDEPPTGECAVVGVSVRIGFWPGAARVFLTPADFGCSHHSDGWAAPAAAARAGDPETSHEAARTIDRLNVRRLDVLHVLDRPMTDVRLVAAYVEQTYGEAPTVHAQSPSGIRSRRHELVQLGLVTHVGTARVLGSGGRMHRVWARTPAGDRAAVTRTLS